MSKFNKSRKSLMENMELNPQFENRVNEYLESLNADDSIIVYDVLDCISMSGRNGCTIKEIKEKIDSMHGQGSFSSNKELISKTVKDFYNNGSLKRIPSTGAYSVSFEKMGQDVRDEQINRRNNDLVTDQDNEIPPGMREGLSSLVNVFYESNKLFKENPNGVSSKQWVSHLSRTLNLPEPMVVGHIDHYISQYGDSLTRDKENGLWVYNPPKETSGMDMLRNAGNNPGSLPGEDNDMNPYK